MKLRTHLFSGANFEPYQDISLIQLCVAAANMVIVNGCDRVVAFYTLLAVKPGVTKTTSLLPWKNSRAWCYALLSLVVNCYKSSWHPDWASDVIRCWSVITGHVMGWHWVAAAADTTSDAPRSQTDWSVFDPYFTSLMFWFHLCRVDVHSAILV